MIHTILCAALVGAVAINGTTIKVDGKPFFIKAVSYDPSYPGKQLFDEIPPAVIDADFKGIKDAGFNAVRTYAPFNDTLLDLAEKHQLYVIEGVLHIDDGTDFRSDETLQQLKQAAVAVVERHKKRPSILFWSLWNDAPFHWGTRGGNVVRRFGAPVVNEFLRAIYGAVKAADPAHPITAANVLNAPGHELGFKFLDLIGLNVYVGISDWASGTFDDTLGEKTVARVVALQASEKKPVWISELGQSDFTPVATQAEVIPAQLALIRGRLAGFSLFEWQDDWSKAGDIAHQADNIETHWGLVDAYRKAKAGFSAVSAAVKATPKLSPREEKAVAIAPGKDAEAVETFSYADSQEMLAAYTVRQKGTCHYRATINNGALLVEVTPEDFGAWLFFARKLPERDWSKYQSLRFRMKAMGPWVNLSPLVLTAGGAVLRGAAIVTKSSDWREFRIDLKSLFRDYPIEKTIGTSGAADLHRVTGIGIRVNDVANFEQIGLSTDISLDDFVLEP